MIRFTVGIALVLFGIIIGANWVTLNANVGSNVGTLPACAEEDSDNCVWDASQRGNGEGVSFVTINGVTYYDVDPTSFQLPTK